MVEQYRSACAAHGVPVVGYVADALSKAEPGHVDVHVDGAHYSRRRERVGGGGVRPLCEALRRARLRASLDLANQGVQDADVVDLALLVADGWVEALDLRGNAAVSERGAALLADALGSAPCVLQSLWLDGCTPGDEGAERLATGLTVSGTLETLSLGRTRLGCAGIVALCSALRKAADRSPLRSLCLDSPELAVGLDDEDLAVHVSHVVATHRALEELSLRLWPRASPTMAFRIAEALERNAKLVALDLSGCSLGAAGGGTVLARAAQSHGSLRHVRLAQTRANDEAAAAWADAVLASASLDLVDLRHCEVASAGLTALLHAAAARTQHGRAVTLLLWGNRWDPDAAAVLEHLQASERLLRHGKDDDPALAAVSVVDVTTFRVDDSDSGVRVAEAEP